MKINQFEVRLAISGPFLVWYAANIPVSSMRFLSQSKQNTREPSQSSKIHLMLCRIVCRCSMDLYLLLAIAAFTDWKRMAFSQNSHSHGCQTLNILKKQLSKALQSSWSTPVVPFSFSALVCFLQSWHSCGKLYIRKSWRDTDHKELNSEKLCPLVCCHLIQDFFIISFSEPTNPYWNCFYTRLLIC